VAAVQIRPGFERPDKDALGSFLRERLKAYELPVEYAFVDEMPRTLSMKISQPSVRALFEPRTS
jgi:long-chain acyl-CoA synthetase